ncbi:MAG: flagellar basal body rod protein FlgC [Halioglobus sp.]|nr:flagellar basal body rod protein FlgC [Halioglobus sp.]
MSLFSVFDVAGSALNAQSVRLSTISSNLANAEVVSGRPDEVYRARYPVFAATLDSVLDSDSPAAGVRVTRIVQSQAEPRREYSPGHPLADAEGYIYSSAINTVEETANMISASRSYQSNIEAMNTAKHLIMQTLNLGR